MGNLLQYTDKSKTIDNKLNSLLSQINYDYQNGNIRTKTEYYYRIKNMLAEFYDSLTKPTFQYRPAVSTPMSDEYNAMITESYNDMEYIIKDCEALGNFVSQSFIDAELGRNMLTSEIAYLSKQIATIGESIAKNQPTGVVVFTELFNDTELMGNCSAHNACTINTFDGILTLQQYSSTIVDIQEIVIDNEVSNGFPGNTHCVDTLNSEMHFVGQEGLHMNLGALVDINKDTWFEFELFSITDEIRKACNSFGFEYDEGVSWINNDDILRLKLNIKLTETTNCSWISISPYLSDIKGIKSCILEKCIITTASNNVYVITKNKALNDTLILTFPPEPVTDVELIFAQPSKYATKVGHFYYTAADTTSMSIFQNYDYSDMFARVDGPKKSVALLNAKYNPATQWIDYPTLNTKYASEEYIKSNIFSVPESTIAKKANAEIIDAYRYMIGLKEVKISSSLFVDYGQYVSKVFVTDEVITSITLEADEYIPGEDSDIIKYFISLDGGLVWHPIYPMHRAYSGIYKYYVNNSPVENVLSNNNAYNHSKTISIAGDPKQVQLKIEMNKPEIENKDYSSPILYQYKLKVTTGGETIEY